MSDNRPTFGQKWGDDPFTALGYTQTPNALIRYASRLGLKSEECWLIVCILRFKYSAGNPMPSQSLLSELFGQSTDTIQRTIQKIVKKGLLRVERSRGDRGTYTHTTYDFTPLREALNRCYRQDHPEIESMLKPENMLTEEVDEGELPLISSASGSTGSGTIAPHSSPSIPQICGMDQAAETRYGPGRKSAGRTRPQKCGTNKTPELRIKESTAEESAATLSTEVVTHLEERPKEGNAAAAAALVEELVRNDLNHVDAVRLVHDRPDECLRQLGFLPYVESFKSSRGAWLRSAIEGGFAPPKAYREEMDRQDRHAQAARRALAAKASTGELERREQALRAELEADPSRWDEIMQAATARLPDVARQREGGTVYQRMLNGYVNQIIRELAEA